MINLGKSMDPVGIKLVNCSSGSAVRHLTDCAMWPSAHIYMYDKLQNLMLVACFFIIILFFTAVYFAFCDASYKNNTIALFKAV